VEFNARLLADSPNAEPTVLRSKAVGEPPLMLAVSTWCAIRDALASLADYRICPRLNAPATPEEILRVAEELRGGGDGSGRRTGKPKRASRR